MKLPFGVALLLTMLLMLPSIVSPQTKPKPAKTLVPDRDQLGMTCAQILEMSSSDWVAQFDEKAADSASGPPKILRAIASYGKCYDERTDRLGAALAKLGTGPLMGARAEFRDFEQALGTFTSKTLAANDPPADAMKTAYAALYAKQFRYEFFKKYIHEPGVKNSAHPSASTPQPASQNALTPTPAPASGAPPKTLAAAPAQDDANPVTMAKNHFGELLDALPEDKEHELHSAFGDIVGRSQMSDATRLELYRYAIFLLEPASAPPFAPPPL